jgi:alpha-mannosidase
MRIKLVHLVDRLLRILETEPDYRHFTLDGQTIVVEDYLRIRPERRGEIVGHVATGRLLIGPWTVLPDEFLVSPESIVRNLLYGTRAAHELGGCMDVGYVPDPFGHIGQLPQILRGFGIESAAFWRGLSDEPCELQWEAPDGSRVFLAYLRESYSNAARLPTDPQAFESVVQRRSERLGRHSAVSHRLLLNGTDHHEPQPEIASLLRNRAPDGDRWLLSTLPAYVAAVREEVEAGGIELPVVRGEFRSPKRQHILAGVLSSRTWIKQRNDRCERLLERWAEPFVAWADRFCAEQPDVSAWTGHLDTPRVRDATPLLDEAWRILLECHPHDSICGCSVDQVHDEMRSRFDEAEQIADEVTRQSLVALADAVDTTALAATGARSALVVFNPAATPRTELARAFFEVGAGLDVFEFVDEKGGVLPHRVLRRDVEELANVELPAKEVQALIRGVEDGLVLGMAVQEVGVERKGPELGVELVMSERGEPHMEAVDRGVRAIKSALEDPGLGSVRLRVRFATRVDVEISVPDLPAHGYRSLGIRPATAETSPKTDDETRISNEWLSVEAAPDGSVTLTDLRSGLSLPGLLRLCDQADRGDSYTFCPVDGEEPIEKPSGPVRIQREREATGEVLEIDYALRVPRRLAPSRAQRSDDSVDLPARLRVRLVPGVPRADVDIEIDNTAEDHRLQVHLPIGTPVEEADYDGHYEIVRRPTKVEDPGPDWSERPTPEQPMRTFVAAKRPESDGDAGLCVAVRGLREACVSPEGVIAVTLLRAFGWLSRDDFSTRGTGAGPAFPVPGGQCLGSHRFELSLIPFTGDVRDAAAEADGFQTTPRGVDTRLHSGHLPPRASLLTVEPSTFRLTAVRPVRDGSVVVRGVYLGDAPGDVRIRPLARANVCERVRLDETPTGTIDPDPDGSLRVSARPLEIVSVRLSGSGPEKS